MSQMLPPEMMPLRALALAFPLALREVACLPS